MMIDEYKEEFEAWIEGYRPGSDLDVYEEDGIWPGQYEDYVVQCCWEAWKAALRAE